MPLDPRGLNCPLPALRTRKMLSRLDGDRLSVKCTDPLAVIDIPHRLRETGDTLECREAARGLFLYIPCQAWRSIGAIFSPVARRCGGIPAPLFRLYHGGTSKDRRFPPPRKSDSRFSYSERGRLAWDSLASSI
jgi:tRNA 2-thiouridine synthesizing protein A